MARITLLIEEILQLGYRKNVVDRGISMDNLPTLLGSQGFWTINTRSLSRCCRSHAGELVREVSGIFDAQTLKAQEKAWQKVGVWCR